LEKVEQEVLVNNKDQMEPTQHSLL
jgi:hypothetical protein